MKRIFLIAALSLTASFSFAGNGDDQNQQIRKLLNRKITFPEKMDLKETVSVEVQFEIMPDGCLALTASNGNAEIVNYVASKIENLKVPYQPGQQHVFVYKFTFEKEK